MDEKNLKLLKFALKMGEQALENVQDVLKYGVDFAGNEYYLMKKELAEILGVSCEDISD